MCPCTQPPSRCGAGLRVPCDSGPRSRPHLIASRRAAPQGSLLPLLALRVFQDWEFGRESAVSWEAEVGPARFWAQWGLGAALSPASATRSGCALF